jgi:uncharacterized protein YfiM (DUF2279 family)
MRGLALLFTLHFGGDEHPAGDRWFAADKMKHFFMAAFVQSASFGGMRAVGMSKSSSLAGATALTAGVSIGKEVHDRRSGGEFSFKDLTWDAAGMAAGAALSQHTRP